MKKLFTFILIILSCCIINAEALSVKETAQKINDFFDNTKYKDVATIIVAMSALESNWYKSNRHVNLNNMFSIKDRKHPGCKDSEILCLAQFDTLEDNLKHMLWYFNYKKYPTERRMFIEHLRIKKYATDPKYLKKVFNTERRVIKLLYR